MPYSTRLRTALHVTRRSGLHWRPLELDTGLDSCRQPRCMLCSSKSHDMDDHPSNEKLKCVNCKGEHPSDHKLCNTRQIQLGLKLIPNMGGKPQQRKPKDKGKEQEISLRKLMTTDKQLNIGLTGDQQHHESRRVPASPKSTHCEIHPITCNEHEQNQHQTWGHAEPPNP